MAANDCTDVAEAETLAIWEQFKASPAAFSDELVEQTSKALFGMDARLSVRAPLLLMTKTGQELIDHVEGDPEMAAMFRQLAESAEHSANVLREAAGLLDTARFRIAIALCAAPEDKGGADA